MSTNRSGTFFLLYWAPRPTNNVLKIARCGLSENSLENTQAISISDPRIPNQNHGTSSSPIWIGEQRRNAEQCPSACGKTRVAVIALEQVPSRTETSNDLYVGLHEKDKGTCQRPGRAAIHARSMEPLMSIICVSHDQGTHRLWSVLLGRGGGGSSTVHDDNHQHRDDHYGQIGRFASPRGLKINYLRAHWWCVGDSTLPWSLSLAGFLSSRPACWSCFFESSWWHTAMRKDTVPKSLLPTQQLFHGRCFPIPALNIPDNSLTEDKLRITDWNWRQLSVSVTSHHTSYTSTVEPLTLWSGLSRKSQQKRLPASRSSSYPWVGGGVDLCLRQQRRQEVSLQ